MQHVWFPTWTHDLSPISDLLVSASKKLYDHLIKATTLISAWKITYKQVSVLSNDYIFSKRTLSWAAMLKTSIVKASGWSHGHNALTTRAFVAQFVVVISVPSRRIWIPYNIPKKSTILGNILTDIPLAMVENPRVKDERNGSAITEDEAALYDRQIRLWGLDAQKR